MTSFPIPLATAVSTGLRPLSRGDRFSAPIQLFGAGDTVDVFFWGGGPEPEEPDGYADVDSSIWLDYLSTEPGTLTITGDPCSVEIGTGDDVTSFAALAIGDPSVGLGVATVIGAATPTKIRVRPLDNTVETVSLTFAFVNLVPDLVLQVLSDLQQAPGTFRVTVTNGVPGEPVTFASSPATIPGGTLDENGALISFAIFIDDARAAGVSTLTASSTDRDDATADFNVIREPLTDPLAQPADADPTEVAPVDGVRKWVLQDPAPGGEQYVFEINPDSATSPWPSKTFTSDVSTAPDGQHLTWEGARKPVVWQFKGTLLTQSQYEALEAFQALNRRVYLIDNRNRAWVVSIESFDPEPKKVIDNPWAHTYTVRAIIYKGPVTPV